MKIPSNQFPALLVLLMAGCTGTPVPRGEKGPDGTIAYYVRIESTEPGSRVEVNDDTVGKTPLDLRVWGDRDGTFHNFGSSDFVVRVFPVREGQGVQTKSFRTGGWFGQEDTIPKHLFFDQSSKSGPGFTAEPGKPRY